MKKLTILLAALLFYTGFIHETVNARASLQGEYKGEDKGQVWIHFDPSDGKRVMRYVPCLEKAECDKPNIKKPYFRERCPHVVKDQYCSVTYIQSRKPSDNPYWLELRADHLFYRKNSATPYDSVENCVEMAKAGGPINSMCRENDLEHVLTIWVMDLKGNLYVAPVQMPGYFHHSSFLAGEPVECAGEIIIKKGKIVYLNRKSGHYIPGPDDLQQALMKLQAQGYPIETINNLDREVKCTKAKCQQLEDRMEQVDRVERDKGNNYVSEPAD